MTLNRSDKEELMFFKCSPCIRVFLYSNTDLKVHKRVDVLLYYFDQLFMGCDL